jgi:hypothetical protein
MLPLHPAAFPLPTSLQLNELERSDEATKVWAEAGKSNKTAYIPWLEYTGALQYAVRLFPLLWADYVGQASG